MTKSDIEKWIREIDEAKWFQEDGVVYLKWSRPFTGNSGHMYLCIPDICKTVVSGNMMVTTTGGTQYIRKAMQNSFSR